MDCSLCAKEIVGVGVLIADESNEWQDDSISFYHSEGGELDTFALLHPVCFVDIFHELLRQEKETYFVVAISRTGNLRESLQIP
jgi:hypothetical protein